MDVERIAAIIRQQHRTRVRHPSLTNEARRTFHQGDREAARDVLAIINSDVVKQIVAWLRSESALYAFRSETCSEDVEAEFGWRAEHFAEAAAAIQRGDHLVSAAPNEDQSNG